MTTRSTESVRLETPAGHLAGTLAAPRGGDVGEDVGEDVVLFVHGFGSTHAGEKARALEAECARRGWPLAGFDFRGHGASAGSLLDLSAGGLLADLDAVLAWLGGRGFRRIFAVGSSMGGWAAAWCAVRHPEVVSAVATVAPAFDFVERRWAALTEAEREAWRATGRLRVTSDYLDVEIGPGLIADVGTYPLAELARRWSAPLLVFHGLRDDVVPWADSLDLARRSAAPVEVRLFSDGDHRLLPYKDEMAAAACQFFARRWGA